MSLRPGRSRGEPEHNFTLQIISYGHVNGPLQIPDSANTIKLLYSVRDVPNPPNLLRKKHTGMSRRLQKEIFLSKEGKARLEQILENIEFKMLEMVEDYSRAPTPEIVSAADVYAPKDSPRDLVVGIMCEEGRHRSVAFVEELGKRIEKRNKWVYSIKHRDLGELGSSEEDEDEDEEGEDGSVSPTVGRRPSKSAKQKDKERKKMLGRRISSAVIGE